MSKSKRLKAISTFLLATIILASNMSSVMAKDDTSGKLTNTYKKIDLSEVTGEIVAPPLLSSAASAIAKEKAWYEYVYYSDTPVAVYYLSDSVRVSFYDPYDYADALIMEVDDSITDWSSNNSMTVSYTTGSSLSNTNGSSTDTSTSVQIAQGQDISETDTNASTVTTTVEGKVNTYNYSKSSKEHSETDDETWTVSEEILGEVTVSAGAGVKGLAEMETSTKGGINVTNTNNFGLVKNWSWKDEDYSYGGDSFSDYNRGYTVDDTTTRSISDAGYSKTTSTIADRFSRATGMSSSTSISFSTNDSTTVSKTYDAGYFNDKGAPLQWKIIKYTVKMPMKYRVECLVDGDWIFMENDYCTLNTIQGTCRAYMSNNVAYYEHWGTGEPVVWEQFWGQFFTESSLIAAYKNRLYPDN